VTDLLVGDVVRRAAKTTPAHPAASLAGETLTFAELDVAANRTARALRDAGIGRGARVAWWGPRATLDVLPLFVALARVGAVFAPLNSALPPDEAGPIVASIRPSLLVTADITADTAITVAEYAGDVPLGSVGATRGPGVDLRRVTLDRAASAETDVDATDHELTERDPHVIFFTSGSTGRPKGVVISHRASCLRTFPPKVPSGRGPILLMFPTFHMAAWNFALWAWQARNELAIVAETDADSLLGTASERRANHLYFIPAVWERVLSALRAGHGNWDLRSVALAETGTSSTPPRLTADIRDAFPRARVSVIYGSTEGGNGTVLAAEDLDDRPGSVGLPHPWVELRLDGGEVCLRSPYLMDRYFDDPDATAAVLRDGWYHTGDLGRLDDSGYLSIAGRVNDVIRSGGEWVVPTDVERVIATVPGVAEVAVVGIPDDLWGELVCAVVAPELGAELTLAGVLSACEARLAPFQRPRRLELVHSLPRTPATGQVRRRWLAAQLATKES
jgi:fatty-acyl-CoA synthase